MQIRTDLALEQREFIHNNNGIKSEEFKKGDLKITRIDILNDEGAKALGKPIGRYITLEMPTFCDNENDGEIFIKEIANEICSILPNGEGSVLVTGLGNTEITPDSLGPKTAMGVLATRHITGEFARSIGLEGLKGVAVLSPGVLGQTGIEVSEIIAGTVERIHPKAVIAIDALVSRRLSRLGCTIQISNTGISPGSGVGNRRRELSEFTLSVPVISIGIPTVVDASTLVFDLTGSENNPNFESKEGQMIVTPKEIDLLIKRASDTLSKAINCALQPDIEPSILFTLV